MKVEVDARGLDCPKPVINTKKAIDQITEGIVVTIVDNKAAKENVAKLAKKLKFNYDIKEEGDLYYISINKGDIAFDPVEGNPKGKIGEHVVYVSTNKMGEGDEKLGEILVKGYFYTLTELKPYPKAIIFVNSGVYLSLEDSSVIEYLKELEVNGVEILSCGTCLDFYGVSEKLAIGSVSNMYTIAETMAEAKNTIRL